VTEPDVSGQIARTPTAAGADSHGGETVATTMVASDDGNEQAAATTGGGGDDKDGTGLAIVALVVGGVGLVAGGVGLGIAIRRKPRQ